MTERRPSRPKVRRPGRPPPPDDAGPSRRVPQPSPSRLRAPARGRHRPPGARGRDRPGPLPARARRRVVLIAMGPDAMNDADINFYNLPAKRSSRDSSVQRTRVRDRRLPWNSSSSAAWSSSRSCRPSCTGYTPGGITEITEGPCVRGRRHHPFGLMKGVTGPRAAAADGPNPGRACDGGCHVAGESAGYRASSTAVTRPLAMSCTRPEPLAFGESKGQVSRLAGEFLRAGR
jgi:hypothetical protein